MVLGLSLALVGLCGCGKGDRHRIAVYRPADAPPLASKALRNTLAQQIPETIVEEPTFEQCLNLLADMLRIEIVVHWDAINAAGVPRDRAVSFPTKAGRADELLKLILMDVGRSDVRLTYEARGDVLVISTCEQLWREHFTCVYDVRPILRKSIQYAEDYPFGFVTAVSSQPASQKENRETVPWAPVYYPPETTVPPRVNLLCERLVQVIDETVEPDSWACNGGRGTIMCFDGFLTVRNSQRVQSRVEEFLNQILQAQRKDRH